MLRMRTNAQSHLLPLPQHRHTCSTQCRRMGELVTARRLAATNPDAARAKCTSRRHERTIGALASIRCGCPPELAVIASRGDDSADALTRIAGDAPTDVVQAALSACGGSPSRLAGEMVRWIEAHSAATNTLGRCTDPQLQNTDPHHPAARLLTTLRARVAETTAAVAEADAETATALTALLEAHLAWRALLLLLVAATSTDVTPAAGADSADAITTPRAGAPPGAARSTRRHQLSLACRGSSSTRESDHHGSLPIHATPATSAARCRAGTALRLG